MQTLSLTARCYFFVICLSLGFCVPAKADPDAFHAFLESLWPRASAQGVSRSTFVGALDGLSEDPSVPIAVAKQPEFERLLSAYFKEAVSPTRVARGRALAETYHRELDAIVGAMACRAEFCSPPGAWRATSAATVAARTSFARWRRLPFTAGTTISSRMNFCPRLSSCKKVN